MPPSAAPRQPPRRNIKHRLGARIRKLRRDRKWRQLDLAVYASVTSSHVSEIELGNAEVCLLTLERIAKALEVTLAELFTDL